MPVSRCSRRPAIDPEVPSAALVAILQSCRSKLVPTHLKDARCVGPATPHRRSRHPSGRCRSVQHSNETAWQRAECHTAAKAIASRIRAYSPATAIHPKSQYVSEPPVDAAIHTSTPSEGPSVFQMVADRVGEERAREMLEAFANRRPASRRLSSTA